MWFRCFAELPDIGYPGDTKRRSKLSDHKAVPDVHEFDHGGERVTSLTWKTRDGSGSASPVHHLAFADFKNESSEHARERVLSALELPGEVLDYHFAIQGVAELLYRRRRTEPGQLAFVEWLAQLDARLVETQESSFRISPDRDEYFRVFALDFLVELNEREGRIREALAFAERFARFRPNVDTTSRLRARVEQLRGEDA
jgi:hypothetical protein